VKNLLKEFKEFIATGDLVTIAVGLILALKVKDVIDAFMTGVVDPIISAIVGKDNFSEFGFDVGDARISIGLVISALINLVVVGAVLFLVVKAYNKFRYREGVEPAPAAEVILLTEIRDELRRRP
jgi:large conductance mechanosensitive channel